MNYLFVCAIGPVQEFIATARRSRDLQYGSWMLSELSKAAAKAVADEYGVNSLVFPAPKFPSELEANSALTVANKVLAIIPREPATLGEKVEQAIRERLNELRRKAFSEIEATHFDATLALRQVDDLLEFYWAYLPFKDGKYIKGRNTAEVLLAARKNTRDFEQFSGKMVPKSSLDASRESAIRKDAYSKDGDQKAKIEHLYEAFGAHRGERLSGVDLLKRQGSKGMPFPSTSELAVAPFLKGLDDGGKAIVDKLLAWMKEPEHFPKFNEKDRKILLYPGRVAEFLTDADTEAFSRELKTCLKEHANGKSPGIYYALLVADGDSMGEKLNKMEKHEDHQNFSKSLSGFADIAKRIIKKYDGTPIYVGGDDIMIYMPLHTTLACMQELEESFTISTLSGGLVIAHHLQPLSDVLQLARAAEKEAKRVDGKNALCIILNKRSGAERTIKGNWPELNARLTELAKYHRHKVVSNGTAYELQKMARTLKAAGLTEADQKDALEQEAIRIIKRKRISGGKAELPPQVYKQFNTWLKADTPSAEELALEMIVAAEFAMAETLADLPLGPLEDENKEATP